MGSKIIVTTRKESVALMMGKEQISMDNLSIEVSWSLFKRHAFEHMDPMGHPELEEVGKLIAAKCKGLPLALKTLAGMLRSKSEVEEWKHILRSEIWELPHNDILPALMLSYNDLPAHLKRCFSYCAIFPKDYPFKKEQVIHLWITNGLILQDDKIIQDSGNQYFLELRSRSLFERVQNPSEGNIEKFLMHDLVNDLAQLRTLLPISFHDGAPLSKRVQHNILPRLRSLRTWIRKLPDSICVLYNLEVLLLSSCAYLEELPLQMEKLINLRHLDISNSFCLKMPLHLSKLKSLQVLVGAKFLLGGHGGSRMDDLGEAQNLYGSLSILELQNVVDRREAAKAKMREKNHVEKLSLEWSESSADNSQTERDILDDLHPHTNIKEL
ncbi:hypothetical protein KY290_008602 [Solanum tuberosum]|uniref:NB-ARC domain-containing protein n=1 Tax=Solanum tuberosum TaxID=4113 RepID=A0ABQ7W8W9_SOLTU|nr:hypothetical protein KY290_008602 [Solanum tuberosum]